MALPTANVERLLLPDEGRLHSREAGLGASAAVGVLVSGSTAYSAWDLGLLLDLPAQSEAWVLLRLVRPQGPLPLALRAGPCLSTGPLPDASLVVLPTTIARDRVGVLSAAFPAPATSRARSSAAPVGLALDLARLWTEAELAAAEEALRAPDAERL